MRDYSAVTRRLQVLVSWIQWQPEHAAICSVTGGLNEIVRYTVEDKAQNVTITATAQVHFT